MSKQYDEIFDKNSIKWYILKSTFSRHIYHASVYVKKSFEGDMIWFYSLFNDKFPNLEINSLFSDKFANLKLSHLLPTNLPIFRPVF